MRTLGAGDQTADLLISGHPALPPVSQPPVMLIVVDRQMTWLWCGSHFVHFTMKHQDVVTQICIVQSSPNFTFDKSPGLRTFTIFSHSATY